MKNDQLSRFDRIVAMLIHLQSRKVVKAQELADRFQVSLRTVYRDIRSLEVSGIPITGEAGIGYSLVEGYRLPPVMFTREEAGSFVAAEKLMQRFSDKMLGAHYQSAMFKIKSVLKGNQRDRIALLENQIWIASAQQLFNEHTPDAMEILLDSIAEKKQIRIKYQSFYSDDFTGRVIEPIGVFHENNYWYVMAYCHLRSDYRQFRTDRIYEMTRTEVPFVREHGNLEDHKRKEVQAAGIEVIISVERDTARYMQSSKKYYGFMSEKIAGSNVEMKFLVNESCDYFCRWFLMFADKAEIIEPDSVRQQLAGLLDKIKATLSVTA